MFNDLNLELKLLRGHPIEIENVGKIHPITINNIIDATIEKYNQHLNVLCIESEDIKKFLNNTEEMQTFEFLYINCYQSPEYRNIVLDALMFFFREEVYFDEKIGFYLGDIQDLRFINQDNYENIKNIIRKLNCLVSEKKVKEEQIKPANEKARKMLEQMQKNKEELDKVKSNNSLNLCDLISIFAAYSENINILNVWELTFYQFNNQFNRLKIMKEYNVNLQVLMHCDTSKNKVDLIHWLSPSKSLK